MPDKKPAEAPIINPEADRILGRMSIQAIVTTIVLVMLVTMFVPLANTPGTKVFHYHKLIDALSVAVVILPFFALTNRVYAGRLRVGRDLVGRGEPRQAIAALEPFDFWHQRFLDGTGEAHFLLSKAYAATGQGEKARKCREFVVKNRKGQWADALTEPESIPVRVSELKQKAQIKGQGAVKTKPTRRF